MLSHYALVLRVVEWGSKRSTVGQQEKIVPPAPSFLVKNKAGWPRAEPIVGVVRDNTGKKLL